MMPPPMDREDMPDPLGLDFLMPDDLFESDPLDFDYLPEDVSFQPFSAADVARSDEPAPAAPSFSSDEGWSWHDATLIAVERANDDGEVAGYVIGAVDLYANTNTGDLGGSYLEIGSFDDLDQAAAYYHELQGEIHDQRLLPFQLVDFVGEKAHERAVEQGQPAPIWRAAGPVEYAAYEDARSLNTSDAPDLPPDDLAFDAIFETEVESERAAADVETPSFKALREIGIAADGFDPETDPPPFIDPDTGTAYWIGVFQPDKDDPENCVTSILSLGRDPNTGEVEAQLAPCVPGDWDKAYSAAEYLLDVVEKDGIDRCLDTAEGMALASDQRELWDAERGIPLEPDAAQDLADYTRDQWDIDL